MKQFYTVRDIEDMRAAGVVEIKTHDDKVGLSSMANDPSDTAFLKPLPSIG